MRLPGMPDTSDLAALATRAVVALERIAEHLDHRAGSALLVKPVTSKCGCTYDAEVNALGKVVERGVWTRVDVCAHHARDQPDSMAAIIPMFVSAAQVPGTVIGRCDCADCRAGLHQRVHRTFDRHGRVVEVQGDAL